MGLGAAAAILGAALPGAQGRAGQMHGTVTAATGDAMEGVIISARAAGQTFTTSVYSDRSGRYAFPELAAGRYTLRAQAVGFEAATADFDLPGDARAERKLTMRPTADFAPQLDGISWLAALPEATPEDLRMKHVFQSNCTGCHQPSFVLQNRFDERGWGIIIDLMARGVPPGPRLPTEGPSATMLQYRDELAAYLARVRGRTDLAQFTLPPRPTGEATQAVVTEYDLPYPERPGYVMPHNGSDWSEGTPSRYEGRSAHDVRIDSKSQVWFGDDKNPGRTIGRLDPTTGKVTEYVARDDKGVAVATYLIVLDPEDNLWSMGLGQFMKFDTHTGQFTFFPKEPGLPRLSLHMSIDSKGNPSVEAGEGLVTLDARTGKHTVYTPVTGKQGTYGLTTDADDNIWMAQPGGDRLMYVESTSGAVGEVLFELRREPWMTPKDVQIAQTLEGSANFGWPQQKGPRRLGADLRGTSLWVAHFKSDQLAKVDIRSKRTVKEYPVPTRYSGPYGTEVDRNHMVWVQMLNGDRIGRFDPATERWVEYQLPTRNTQMRHLTIDNRTNPPTIWAPYGGTNKIMRLQIRPASTRSR